MDSSSHFKLGVSEMLDLIESGKNKLTQKAKTPLSGTSKEKNANSFTCSSSVNAMPAESGKFVNVHPNFRPTNFDPSQVPPYQNFTNSIEPNSNIPPPNLMNVDQTLLNIRPIAPTPHIPGHPLNLTHSGQGNPHHSGNQFGQSGEYPLNIKHNYMHQHPPFIPASHNHFPVPQPHQEIGSNCHFSFPPPPRHSNSFYFNHPAIIHKSSTSPPKRNDESPHLDKKKKKKKRLVSESTSSSTSITPLPPPPSPPNLGPPRALCYTPPPQYSQPKTSPNPSSANSPLHYQKSYSPIYSKAPPLPPPQNFYMPPLPSSPPPPPEFENFTNKPPEPKEPPPDSPLSKDSVDYSPYKSKTFKKSMKKEKKKSTSHLKPSKSYKLVEDEFFNLHSLDSQEKLKIGDNKESIKKRKSITRGNEEETNWKKVEAESYPGSISSSTNFVNKRGKYNYLNEPPPFNPLPEAPCNTGSPGFNAMPEATPPFPLERPPFPVMGRAPFNLIERPPAPFIGRGVRPPNFNMMGGRPPVFHPMRMSRPPPFHPMGAGRPPFQPGVPGPPRFRPMGGGPRFQPRGMNPPFHVAQMPAFNAMGEGRPAFETATPMAFEQGPEYEEFYYDDDDDGDDEDKLAENDDYEYFKEKKDQKKSQKLKNVKSSKERRNVEQRRSSKSTRVSKHSSKSTKCKEPTKHERKNVKLKSKKKIIEYELEPGEYISDLESDVDDDSSSTTESNSESDFDLSNKEQQKSEDSTHHSDVIEPEHKKSWNKSSKKQDAYTLTKHKIIDYSDSSETLSDSPIIKEKPKYPRYFKDKVAYTSDIPKIFDDEPDVSSPKVTKENQSDIKKNVAEEPLKKPLSPPILSESLKVTKTPLIKRLGLVEKNHDSSAFQFDPQDDHHEENQTKTNENIQIDTIGNSNNTALNDDDDDDKNNNNNYFSDKDEDREILASFHSPSSLDRWNHRNRSNSLSPNNSLDYEEVRLLASTKEILSASKSIFKSPTSPKITTTKKRYEKPIIKIETASKPLPLTKVEESPHRIDLDSRIKIMFGSSGEEESPEKRSLRNAAISHKSMRLMSRPPSPFRSKNAYQFWHRETYYYRKHNPIPKEFADPTERRKIGIQIKDFNESGISDLKNEDSHLEDLIKLSNNTTDVKKLTELDSQFLSTNIYENKSKIESLTDLKESLSISCIEAIAKTTKDSPENCDKITKVNILPDTEIELISEDSEHKLTDTILNSSELEKFNFEEIHKNEIITLVLNKIVDEFKSTIKNKLTEDLIKEKLDS